MDICTGCDTCICVTIYQALPLSATTTATPACVGASNGSATVNVNGGTPSYSYQWSNGQTTPTIINLAPGVYTVVVTDANGCTISATATVGVVICGSNISLNLKAFIQGYYLGSSQMAPVMFNQGVTTNTSITDFITVELRQSVPPYAVAATTTAVLSTSGLANCNFPSTPPGNYYIAVKHRNAVQTWSAAPVSLSATPTLYDFSISDAQAYGNNMVQVSPGVWAFYSGDIDQDENVSIFDYILYEADAFNFMSGYVATDINGDGTVDLLDAPILDDNIQNFIYSIHP